MKVIVFFEAPAGQWIGVLSSDQTIEKVFSDGYAKVHSERHKNSADYEKNFSIVPIHRIHLMEEIKEE